MTCSLCEEPAMLHCVTCGSDFCNNCAEYHNQIVDGKIEMIELNKEPQSDAQTDRP